MEAPSCILLRVKIIKTLRFIIFKFTTCSCPDPDQDGHFVPNLTFGAPIIACLRKNIDAILDVHLMVYVFFLQQAVQ